MPPRCSPELQELAVTRHVVTLKGTLQRMNPVDQADTYNRMFGELIALDGRVKQLREQALGAL